MVNKEIEELSEVPINLKLDFKEDDIKKLEIKELLENDNYRIFKKRKILIRNIIDYIAGMTDGYALKEYNRIF